MPNSIVLNGIKTRETCPCCLTEDILIEHGHEERGEEFSLHLEHCPECGESIVIVGYDCPECHPVITNCIKCGSADLYIDPGGKKRKLCAQCLYDSLKETGVFS